MAKHFAAPWINYRCAVCIVYSTIKANREGACKPVTLGTKLNRKTNKGERKRESDGARGLRDKTVLNNRCVVLYQPKQALKS
jgi:hypothetical protein